MRGPFYRNATSITASLRRRRPRLFGTRREPAAPACRAESDGNKAATEACQADERDARDRLVAQWRGHSRRWTSTAALRLAFLQWTSIPCRRPTLSGRRCRRHHVEPAPREIRGVSLKLP